MVQKREEVHGLGVVGQPQFAQCERGEFEIRLVNVERRNQPETARGVDRVAHVQVMRPALGPVFPGVGGGVGADKIPLPVGGWAFGVVALQTGGVVDRLVTEQLVEPVHPPGASDQPVPVVMTHLMAKVTQQGAVRLPHGFAGQLPGGVIGLVHVEGDQTRLMARHDGLAAGRGTQQVKGQPARRVFRDSGCHRQAQNDERRDQSPLGSFDQAPEVAVVRLAGVGQIGDGAVQAAGAAEVLRIVRGDQPVARGWGCQVHTALVQLGAGWAGRRDCWKIVRLGRVLHRQSRGVQRRRLQRRHLNRWQGRRRLLTGNVLQQRRRIEAVHRGVLAVCTGRCQ